MWLAMIDNQDVAGAMQDSRHAIDQTPLNGGPVYIIILIVVLSLWKKITS